MELKIMTYNIAGGRDYNITPKSMYSPQAVIDVIKGEGPVLCGLNEVDNGLPRSNCDDLANVIGQGLGFEDFFAKAVHWHPGDYGNGLVSKYHILRKEVIPIEDPLDRREKNYYEPRCVLKAVVDFPGMPTDVYVTHFGLPRSEQTSALATLLNILKDDTNPLILMGDFNVTPDDPYIQVIKSILHDTFDESENQNDYSYPSDLNTIPCSDPNGKRIDYIFVNDAFKVKNSYVKHVKASDHCPYITTLEY